MRGGLRDGGGKQLAVRMTYQVQDALFGPSPAGTPEWQVWQAAGEQRRRGLGDLLAASARHELDRAVVQLAAVAREPAEPAVELQQ